MELGLSKDKNWLIIDKWDDDLHYKQLCLSLKRKIKNFYFHPLVKKKVWDGSLNFVEKGRLIPVGLWHEVKKIGIQYNIPITFRGLEHVVRQDLPLETIQDWCTEFFKDDELKPRDYQVAAAWKILKYQRSIAELATSSGKTLIAFIVFAYLIDNNLMDRAIMVVPNTNLVIQGLQDFMEFNNGRLPLKIQQVHGGAKETIKDDCNIIIGTFQSLVKKEKDFYDKCNVIFIDEAHQTNATSIKKILGKATNAHIRFGLSGTLIDDQTADFFTIQAFIGPLVLKITPNFLFKNKYATPVNIKILKLDYVDVDIKQKLHGLRTNKADKIDGSTLFSIEKQLVVDNKKRFDFITDFISKSTKNSLVLFINVKDKYGERIYDRLRENDAKKEVFYIDGSTSEELREEYKKRLEEGENKILVASFGTFSTGISIKKISNIYFVESYKSEILVKQSIGRGMRLHDTKTEVNIIDFVDDFSYKNDPNYLLKHSQERINIYEREGFIHKIYDIKL